MTNTLKELGVQFERALLLLDKDQASALLDQAKELGDLQRVIQALIVEPLLQIGEHWQEGRVSLSQVYMSGRICEELIDALLPQSTFIRQTHPRMAIAVLQDFHALGKRIIYSSLRASGFELYDFGHGLSVEQVVQQAQEKQVEVLLISVLMYPSALKVKELTTQLQGSGIKVMVGGAPFNFNPHLWQQVGADAVGMHAADAIAFAHQHTTGTTS